MKWVKRVVVSDEEAHSTWQRGVAYKGFPSNVTSWNRSQQIRLRAGTSRSICDLSTRIGIKLDVSEETIEVSGYAWSGGGRGIVRVGVQ